MLKQYTLAEFIEIMREIAEDRKENAANCEKYKQEDDKYQDLLVRHRDGEITLSHDDLDFIIKVAQRTYHIKGVIEGIEDCIDRYKTYEYIRNKEKEKEKIKAYSEEKDYKSLIKYLEKEVPSEILDWATNWVNKQDDWRK